MAILQFLRAFGQRTLKNNLRALPFPPAWAYGKKRNFRKRL
jgi:hypothetical protein